MNLERAIVEDGVAVIEQPAANSSKFNKGQRVVGTPLHDNDGGSTWQQYLAVPEDRLLAVPDNVSDADAAQFGINPVTAWGMLEWLKAPEGEYILQTAAGSALGRMFIALAKHKGVKTINVVRRPGQKKELLEIGGDEVIATDKEQDLEERVKQITGGKGAWGAIDAVGADQTSKLVRAVRFGGEVLVYGLLAGNSLTSPVLELFGKTIVGYARPIHLAQLPPGEAQHWHEEVLRLDGKGVIKPLTGETYALEDCKKAVKASQEVGRSTSGKVLLQG